jgi:hypothetical protein
MAGADDLALAAATWVRRQGPARKVVDMVCLVPDVPTFFEAISVWDETHFFPILIDDVELSFKFIRAFRPARIVRYPRKAAPIPPGGLWNAAAGAVARSWSNAAASPRGETVPRSLGPTPPGAVISHASSPMLAGAVALAAGRFQPLLRWETTRHFSDQPSREEALRLAEGLESTVSDTIAACKTLGDDCDFLTLAGDWPYRYHDKRGPAAFDDLVGRNRTATSHPRWALAGRLLGDPTASVYRAMCSLFLTADSALLLNAYTNPNSPWSEYRLTEAADRLAPRTRVTLREGERASLTDWHRVFDPRNRFGLLMINTNGEPSLFHLPGGPGVTSDIPPSEPTAILIIHSFSAEDPTDPETIAGRWLANGAFAYFGAVNEPYLQGFRAPAQVAGLIEADLPLAAAGWRTSAEPYGRPWRLVYLGDPLYRPFPRNRRVERLEAWAPVATWPSYGEHGQPGHGSTEAERVEWALKTALFQLQRTARPQQRIDLPAFLLTIRRERLDSRLAPIFDALLVDSLSYANQDSLLLERLARIGPAAPGSLVARTRQALQMARLQRLVTARDLDGAVRIWSAVVQTDPPAPLLEVATQRVAALADTPARCDAWRTQLRVARRGMDGRSPLAVLIDAELKRTAAQLTERR